IDDVEGHDAVWSRCREVRRPDEIEGETTAEPGEVDRAGKVGAGIDDQRGSGVRGDHQRAGERDPRKQFESPVQSDRLAVIILHIKGEMARVDDLDGVGRIRAVAERDVARNGVDTAELEIAGAGNVQPKLILGADAPAEIHKSVVEGERRRSLEEYVVAHAQPRIDRNAALSRIIDEFIVVTDDQLAA